MQKIEEVKLIRAWKIDSDAVKSLFIMVDNDDKKNLVLETHSYVGCYHQSRDSPHKMRCFCYDVQLISLWNAAERLKMNRLTNSTT